MVNLNVSRPAKGATVRVQVNLANCKKSIFERIIPLENTSVFPFNECCVAMTALFGHGCSVNFSFDAL